MENLELFEKAPNETVREAFIRLSQKGLLEILPQRGTFVSKIHTEQLAEFRFFRVTLERAIVELACQDFPDPWRTKLEFCIFEQGKFIISKDAEKFFKSDNTLHSLLYEGCGKPHIWQIVQESNLDYARARVLNVSDVAEQMHLPESTIRLLLKPYAPKPHLTQKIEGLDRVKAQLDEKAEQSRKNHPAGRNYKGKRNGGK